MFKVINKYYTFPLKVLELAERTIVSGALNTTVEIFL